MIGFQDLYTKFTEITKDPSATNVTRAKAFINEKNQEILGLRNWRFTEKDRTRASVASLQYYPLPGDCQTLLGFWTVSGGLVYTPTEITDLNKWNEINATSSYSDITEYFMVKDNNVYLYPTPATTGVTLHFFIRRLNIDMTNDDYVTGNVTITAADQTVTGAGTTFTAGMVGRYVKLGGLYYEIETYTSGTEIEIARPAVKAASAETTKIVEASMIPGEFHDMIWKGAVSDYFDFKGEKNPWEKKYQQRLILLVAKYGHGGSVTSSQVMRRGDSAQNPNDYPTGLHE